MNTWHEYTPDEMGSIDAMKRAMKQQLDRRNNNETPDTAADRQQPGRNYQPTPHHEERHARRKQKQL